MGENLLVGSHTTGKAVDGKWEQTFGERKSQGEPFVTYVMCYPCGKLVKSGEECDECGDRPGK